MTTAAKPAATATRVSYTATNPADAQPRYQERVAPTPAAGFLYCGSSDE